ncbi:WD40 repeat-like protein [Suillus hirtellus]|nr:WD40 repeat-like protein [Suillus hirtellus]
MISGSEDKTTRQWDLEADKEIVEAQDVCKQEVHAVGVSKDGRWVVSAGGNGNTGELKVCEVETGIVRRFEGHSRRIYCIDISGNSTLLASGSWDGTVRIWSLETGKRVTVPFKRIDWVVAVRFSRDYTKLAVQSMAGRLLQVWDVQSQKLDIHTGKPSTWGYDTHVHVPVFWTTRDTIVSTFSFKFKSTAQVKTIYEFDASTLKTIGEDKAVDT